LSDPQNAETLHDLSHQFPTNEEFDALMISLEKMEDRAAVLVLSSIIDNLLEYAILTKFVRLNKKKRDKLFRNPTAPLSSMSAKIAVANALGILGDEPRAQLDRIRSIRNAFAHAMKTIMFDDPLIAEECKKLDPRRIISGGTYQPSTDSARERFQITGTLISMILMKQIDHGADQIRYGRYGPLFWRAPSRDRFEWSHPPPFQNQD
jgi:hypothetical protein